MRSTKGAATCATVVTAVLITVAMAVSAQAGMYVWGGGAGDGDWDTTGNWWVTGSTWTWPNEQFGDEYMNEDSDQVMIINGDTVNRSPGLSPDGARDGSNTAVLTLDNGSTLNVAGTIWIADYSGTQGRVDVLGGSALNVDGELKAGDDDGSIGTLNVVDSTVDLGSNLKIVNRAGGTAFFNVSGNSTINVGGKLYMNDGGGSEPSLSEVVMDGGLVNVFGNSYFNDDASNGTALFTLNDGTYSGGGVIDISWNLDGISHLTINGGEMTAGDAIRLGVSGGGDTGESRIFLNDGLLQGEGLQFNMTDSLIFFTGGQFRVNGAAVSETDMQNLIDTGKIDVSGAPTYMIYTDAAYTVLAVPEPSTLALLAMGVLGLALAYCRRRR